jgi:hypothetical protein
VRALAVIGSETPFRDICGDTSFAKSSFFTYPYHAVVYNYRLLLTVAADRVREGSRLPLT